MKKVLKSCFKGLHLTANSLSSPNTCKSTYHTLTFTSDDNQHIRISLKETEESRMMQCTLGFKTTDATLLSISEPARDLCLQHYQVVSTEHRQLIRLLILEFNQRSFKEREFVFKFKEGQCALTG